MFEWIKEEINREVRYTIEDIKYGIATHESIEKLIKSLEDLRSFINEKIEELSGVLEVERLEKETFEEFEKSEEKKGYKELTAHELLTIALAQKPKAPEKIKREAEAIIEKYGLTEEEIMKAYEFVFGEIPVRWM